jgi:SAM-dependent methyltransferase
MKTDAVSGYSGRVAAYARHRWDYAPEAVEAFSHDCGLSGEWVAADIGSGTGMVTAHLLDRVRTIYAVEPNGEMREVATRSLGMHRAYRAVAATSDRTTLEDRSIDLITVGRALHWFPAEPTKREFHRILKPDGWLAVFSTPCTDLALVESLKTVESEEYGWNPALARFTPQIVPVSYYFDAAPVQTVRRSTVVSETFEMLLGRVSSQLATPAPLHPRRRDFERALRRVFDRHAAAGVLTVPIVTEIVFGRPGGG